MITATELLVIDDDGGKRGVMSKFDAMKRPSRRARSRRGRPAGQAPRRQADGLRQIQNQEQKKAAEARKNQKIIEIKEIKMRPMIDDHDYDVKMRSSNASSRKAIRSKVTLRFRGREMAHMEIGMELLQKVKRDTTPSARSSKNPNSKAAK